MSKFNEFFVYSFSSPSLLKSNATFEMARGNQLQKPPLSPGHPLTIPLLLCTFVFACLMCFPEEKDGDGRKLNYELICATALWRHSS